MPNSFPQLEEMLDLGFELGCSWWASLAHLFKKNYTLLVILIPKIALPLKKKSWNDQLPLISLSNLYWLMDGGNPTEFF